MKEKSKAAWEAGDIMPTGKTAFGKTKAKECEFKARNVHKKIAVSTACIKNTSFIVSLKVGTIIFE